MDTQTIDRIIDRHQAEPSALIQILLDIQKDCNWLPPTALKDVSRKLSVPMTRIQHVATFYKAFSMVPKGRHRVNICMGTACHVRGASRILETVREQTGIGPGETDLEHMFSVETVNCLGCCALGPVIDISGRVHGRMTRAETTGVLERCT
jgi:NADH-quinone oxidoreductase subunit E